jgi:hypothetical protein
MNPGNARSKRNKTALDDLNKKMPLSKCRVSKMEISMNKG